ncbi:hypothetical protein BH10ACT3_BH10ACT3_15640 [soil metagenome]
MSDVPPSSRPSAEHVPTEAEDEDLAAELQELVYGSLTVLVALGALSGSEIPPSPRNGIAVIIGVAFATLLAHTFSALVALHVRARRPLQPAEFRAEFRHSWRIVLAAMPAAAMFVLSAFGVFGTRTAIRLSTVLAVLVLMAVGLIAARRSLSTTFGAVVFVAVATLMGLVIVAIEIFVHHHM